MTGSKDMPSQSPSMPQNNDLKHRDWLLFTLKKLIQLTTPQVSVKIIDTSDGGKRLLVENINEYQISIMKFLTNTDQNNNYLYLENIVLRLEDSVTPLEIEGLREILINMFQLSDTNGYLNDSKTHIPFGPNAFNGESLGNFIDRLTAVLPYEPNTIGKAKIFSLVLNPDLVRSIFKATIAGSDQAAIANTNLDFFQRSYLLENTST